MTEPTLLERIVDIPIGLFFWLDFKRDARSHALGAKGYSLLTD